MPVVNPLILQVTSTDQLADKLDMGVKYMINGPPKLGFPFPDKKKNKKSQFERALETGIEYVSTASRFMQAYADDEDDTQGSNVVPSFCTDLDLKNEEPLIADETKQAPSI